MSAMRIAVASGKGGTGKTTIALGLALVSEDVTLVDCDVEEPDDHLFLDGPGELVEEVEIPVARVDEDVCTHCGECARQCPLGALAVLKDLKIDVSQRRDSHDATYSALAAVMSDPSRSTPLLAAAHARATAPREKLAYALILGVLGDDSGLDTLLEAVRRQTTWETRLGCCW